MAGQHEQRNGQGGHVGHLEAAHPAQAGQQLHEGHGGMRDGAGGGPRSAGGWKEEKRLKDGPRDGLGMAKEWPRGGLEEGARVGPKDGPRAGLGMAKERFGWSVNGKIQGWAKGWPRAGRGRAEGWFGGRDEGWLQGWAKGWRRDTAEEGPRGG